MDTRTVYVVKFKEPWWLFWSQEYVVNSAEMADFVATAIQKSGRIAQTITKEYKPVSKMYA